MISWLVFITIFFLLLLLGKFVVGQLPGSSWGERLAIYPVVGFVIYTLGLYVTSLFNIRSWLPLFILPLIGYSLVDMLMGKPVIPKISIFSRYKKILVIAGLGILCQVFTVFPNGIGVNGDIYFYGTNAHDGLWHAALIRELANNFPPQLPIFSNLPLKGYHYFVDFFLSDLVRLFDLSPFDLLFRMLPCVIAIHLGYSSFLLMRRLTRSVSAQVVAVFLTYFSGSLGFLLSWLNLTESQPGETVFWGQQSISTMSNLPLAVSYSVLLVILLLMTIDSKKSSIKTSMTISLLVGSMVAIKSYGGVLVLGGYLFYVIYNLFSTKKLRGLSYLFLSVILSTFLIYVSFENKSVFIFAPGNMLQLMMESPDRVNLPQWETLRISLANSGNLIGLLFLWLIALLAFGVGNLSQRLIGIVSIPQLIKKHPAIGVVIYSIIMAGLVLPLLMIQKGVGWNTIQFLYYSLFLSNLLAAYMLTS